MATTTTRETRVVSTEDLVYLRSIPINFKAYNCKPNTRLYPFFDTEPIGHFITPTGGTVGAPIVTDSNGEASGVFLVPAMTFRAGQREFVLTERSSLEAVIEGMVEGKAVAIFTGSGIKQTLQTTVTNTTVVEIQLPPPAPAAIPDTNTGGSSDPIAQSFDTFGVKGGCFVKYIDVFYREKDSSVPVLMEIREMVNGYPGPNKVSSKAFVVKYPADINTSADASVSTRYEFPELIYLHPDKEYCFVQISNSKNYYIYIGELGKVSLETGKVIYEQSHLGSMFRSQNNSTWTASQFEDVKFDIGVAKFDVSSVANISMKSSAAPVSLASQRFTTVSGSSLVTVGFPYRHGLDLSSKLSIQFTAGGVYNGITAVNMNGDRAVAEIVDDFILKFQAGSNATSSGEIKTGGFVSGVFVTSGGSNYDDLNPPTVSFVGGGGSGAAGTAIVSGGKVTMISVTTKGSGYTSQPAVVLTSALGGGAVCVSDIETSAVVECNKVVHSAVPSFKNFIPSETSIESKLKTRLASYAGSGITSYTVGKEVGFTLGNRFPLNQNTLLAAPVNETLMMSGNKSSEVAFILSSDNENVSPILDHSHSKIFFDEHVVNNQNNEDILSLNQSGTVGTATVVSGGVGYISPVTASVVSVDGNGSGATVDITVSLGVITAVTIANPGSGYTSAPNLVITGQTPSTPAVITLGVSTYNSELSAAHGNSKARYITKPQKLLDIGTGARLILRAYSTVNTSVDVYFKGSQISSDVAHKDHPWVRMECDVERNMSKKPDEFFDYTFYIDKFAGGFNVFQYKIVLNSRVPHEIPVVQNYRSVITS